MRLESAHGESDGQRPLEGVRAMTDVQERINRHYASLTSTAERKSFVRDLKEAGLPLPNLWQPPRRSAPLTIRSESFRQAAEQPLSNAAMGAMHDKLRARHRPGGKVMPRPRWAADEPPLDGWDALIAELKREQGPDALIAELKGMDAIDMLIEELKGMQQ